MPILLPDLERLTMYCQTWNLSKILHRQIFRRKILHRQFHLISTVLVMKTQKNEWKWRNLHHWPKFFTMPRSICGGEELLNRLVLRRCLVCARMVQGRYTMLLRETGMQRAWIPFFIYFKKRFKELVGTFPISTLVILSFQLSLLLCCFSMPHHCCFSPLQSACQICHLTPSHWKKRAGPWVIFKCQ